MLATKRVVGCVMSLHAPSLPFFTRSRDVWAVVYGAVGVPAPWAFVSRTVVLVCRCVSLCVAVCRCVSLCVRGPRGVWCAQGHLAVAYGELLRDMWSGRFVRVAPSAVKHIVGIKAPRFQGSHDHDAVEFMSFFLSGLHEDLNRVLRKPEVEDVESDGRPDAVVSTLSWAAYKKRNDSIITDLCCGLVKCHVTCSGCDREATKFDPSLFVSVPVPVADDRFFADNYRFFIVSASLRAGDAHLPYSSPLPAHRCVHVALSLTSHSIHPLPLFRNLEFVMNHAGLLACAPPCPVHVFVLHRRAPRALQIHRAQGRHNW
jgi:hypothetical protein